MAGKIISDQIEHSTAGSLDTQYVVNGSAKAWNRISISGGTPSIDDSLNASTVTDVAAGKYQTNLTTNMGNTNYLASNFSSYQNTGQDLDRYGTGDFSALALGRLG